MLLDARLRSEIKTIRFLVRHPEQTDYAGIVYRQVNSRQQ